MALLVLLSAEGLSQRAADSTELDTFLCNYLTSEIFLKTQKTPFVA